VALYVASLVLAFLIPWISIALSITVVVIWVIPDRRVVRGLGDETN
jgi:hypothetical protein